MTGRGTNGSTEFDDALAAARAALNDGAGSVAVQRVRSICARWPSRPDTWSFAAELLLRAGDPPGALAASRRLVALSPASGRARALLARGLLAQGDKQAARDAAEATAALSPDDALALANAGCVLAAIDEHEVARCLFARAVALAPDIAGHWFNLAMEERALGMADAAALSCERVIALNPHEYEIYLTRSQLRRQTAERNNVASLIGRLEAGVRDWRGESQLLYALAKEYEDLGRRDDAYAALSRGAGIRRRNMTYDVEREIATIDALIAGFPSDRFHSASAGFASDEPVFIVGMPRTGTTLAERILSSHPAVHAAGELTAFAEAMMAAIRGTAGGENRSLVERAAALDMVSLGRDYIARTRPQTGHSQRFIDKLPLNFLYCGLIRLALPNARIIHLTRDPLDACHAVLKTYFTGGYPFSYDIRELAAYYAAYRRLMDHWHRVMPGVIMDLAYEDLVHDLEPNAQRLVAHCGLDWDPVCLDFHRNAAPSTTASADQVRRPLYSSSIGQSRHYPAFVNAMRVALAENGIDA